MELGPGQRLLIGYQMCAVRDLKTSLTRLEVVSFFGKLHNVFIDVLASMKFE